MYKYLTYIGFLIFTTVILTGCKKETEDISKITYYATFDMKGDAYMILEKGTPYVEPGVTASEDGVDLPVVVDGSANGDVAGVYYINYSAVNSDGYSASITRKIRVIEYGFDNLDISGKYNGIRNNKNAGGIVTITKIGPGVFEIDDILGGYYWQGPPSYGPNYAANGIFTENADGTWTSSQGFVPGWADPTEAQDIVINGGVISYFALMIEADFGFDVTLTKVE
ncbi:MAG: BT_2262 family domain-containing protein [Bacteroidales bacterium]|jgi:hypothetical protein